VWNPGAERAAALSDLDAGGYRNFLCVEAANIGVPVRLGPGAEWRGRQRLVQAGI
jgi:glucose-6-phosphate 1-epimerase